MSGIVIEKKNGKTIIRVVETRSSSAEKPETSEDEVVQRPAKRTFLHDVLGLRLLFHLTNGVRMEGILDGFDQEFIRLENVLVRAITWECETDWVLVDRRQVSHIQRPARTMPRRDD